MKLHGYVPGLFQHQVRHVGEVYRLTRELTFDPAEENLRVTEHLWIIKRLSPADLLFSSQKKKKKAHLNVLGEKVVRVQVHRREVSRAIELENYLDRTTESARSVVPPADPFVP